MHDTRAFFISIWGIAGVVTLLVKALVRLTPIALEPIREGELGSFQWLVLVGWVVTNAYAEGLVGFHRRFSPRTVDRSLYLGRNPTLRRVLLAPFFCLGMFDASRRTRTIAWVIPSLIVILVWSVRHLPQPWRGIVDAGVVVGLAIGLASLIGLFLHGVVTNREPVLHDVPESR